MKSRRNLSQLVLIGLVTLSAFVFVQPGPNSVSPAAPAPAAARAPAGGVPAPQQYPIADKVADKVIQKYQTSSCEELAARKREQPPPQQAAMMQRAVTLLKQDPQMRAYFINKVAPPIANKLFECGFIP